MRRNMNIEILRPESMSYLDQYETFGYGSKSDMVEDALEMLRDKLNSFPHLSKGQLQRIASAKTAFDKGNYITNSHADQRADEWLNT